MRSSIILTAILFCALTNSNAQTTNYKPSNTTIAEGKIEGVLDPSTGLHYYLGVPFAKPPVGELRWKAPQPLNKWSGVKTTKKFGSKPVQTNVFGDMQSRSDSMSEDCLYLNVWTLAKPNEKANKPVLVYFYGGGFVAGDASEPRYDGASMAMKGIVAVTVNYRLNIFGFFAHPGLSAEAPYKASGNYGLLDQQFALAWVKQNIAAFGGDPNKVTIAGESAGSISVSYQMASPLSKNLFAGAIGESGAGINPTLAPVPLQEAENTGVEFAKKAGYTSIEQLRATSTKEIFDAYNASKRFGFPVVIDKYFISKTLPETFAAKEQAMVPLLAGWNSAEISGAAFMYGKPFTTANYVERVKQDFPNDVDEVIKLYPSDSASVEWSATSLASDRFIAYSTWKWLDLQATNSSKPVYRYLYSKLRPALADKTLASGLAGGTVKKTDATPAAPPALGAPHACEIEYCMGNLSLVKDYSWTADDYAVSAVMQQYFANFIINGNPNGGSLAEWPAVKPGDPSPSVMLIDVKSKSQKTFNDARYHFLDKGYLKK